MGPLPSWHSPLRNLAVMGLEARPGAEGSEVLGCARRCCLLSVCPSCAKGLRSQPCDACFLAKPPVDTHSCPPPLLLQTRNWNLPPNCTC